MKTLKKSQVIKGNQVAHVIAERDALREADNDWIVKLYYSFQVSFKSIVMSSIFIYTITFLPIDLQDFDNLYFVMEYIPGGDLMSLLIKFGRFDEDLARFALLF